MTGPSSVAAAYGLRYIPLSYDSAESERSALRLVYSLFPEWETAPGEIKFTRFTDGITNTLLRAAKWRPGWTPERVDDDAILLRAYGRCTEVLIDRDKETKNHLQLAERGLAPPLLASFNNGLLYRFIRGKVCSAHDLQQERVWRGVARRLGEWHARMPVEASVPAVEANGHEEEDKDVELALPNYTTHHTVKEIHSIAPGKIAPNPWTVMQKWIFALPGDEPDHSDADRERKAQLQGELHRVVRELADLPGIGVEGMVLAHCDLLCGNVIVLPKDRTHRERTTATSESTFRLASERTNDLEPEAALSSKATSTSSAPSSTPSSTAPSSAHSPVLAAGQHLTASDSEVESVAIIDYEYATPGPAAFDLANHFAEWGGLDCDYASMPTRAVRREFLREYLQSYYFHLSPSSVATTNGITSTTQKQLSTGESTSRQNVSEDELDTLFELVDRFRGLPGLYWGIWALIQNLISTIDFDYERYAQLRLSEYWSLRATEANGGKPVEGDVREQRWAQEE